MLPKSRILFGRTKLAFLTIISNENILFLSRTSRQARALQSMTFVLIYLEMDFVAGLDMRYSNSNECKL